MIEIGIAAEEHGWDGLFLWDHVVRPIGGEWPVADPDAGPTLTALPGPVQEPRIPIWCGVKADAARPARRAARYDGIVPVDVGPDEVHTLLDIVRAERGSLDEFDVALITAPGAEI